MIYAADLSAPFVRSEDRWPLDVVGQGEEPAPGMLLPWYRTWWALLLWLCCALGVASGVAWAYGRRQGRRLALRDVALGAPVPGHGPDVAQQHTAAERANVELHELNHFLEATTVELRDALEQNKEFLGIAAHDLKNPIGGIAGMADFLASGASDLTDDELRDNLVLIRSEAMRAIKLIESLLDDARAGAEGPRLRRRPVDLADIARAVLRWNQAQAEAKRIQLVSDLPASLPAHADASALQRAVDNYVSNAVKYSPPGSRVRLVVSVEAASGDGSASAHIAVEDEGPGLTEDDRARVFGKLQRLSAQPTGGEHSTGLGLYIVKQLVEAHGGEVGVDSEAGKGATFWLRVPLPPPHPFAEPPAAQAGSFSA
ncbi:MAG: HAMP domain-containing sensor histidine kinase [Bacteroidota bacterium]